MAITVKPLNNTQVMKAKATDKPLKLRDGYGLYLYVSKSGVKSWRFDYKRPFTKKRATMTIGRYPEIGLAQAREIRSEFNALLAMDVDPQEHHKEIERERVTQSENTFAVVAEEFISRLTHLAEGTRVNKRRFAKKLNRHIGEMPVNQIRAIDVLNACLEAEKKGHYEVAHKMKTFCSQVLRYAVQTARAERDVTQDLRGALKTPQVKHLASIIEPDELGHLLTAMDNYNGSYETQVALSIIPYLFVRSGELRHAKWEDINWEDGLWSFTPRKTRQITGIQLIVPLAPQVLEKLKLLRLHRRSEYLFPAFHTNVRPMSENTLTQALRRLGYTGEQQTVHGFRATARTLIVEKLEYPEHLVEMQLGHRVRDMHGRAYNRTTFLDKRIAMMRDWADYLDSLKK